MFYGLPQSRSYLNGVCCWVFPGRACLPARRSANQARSCAKNRFLFGRGWGESILLSQDNDPIGSAERHFFAMGMITLQYLQTQFSCSEGKVKG
jgi:hypothetical protein